jgi:hypothetical protein
MTYRASITKNGSANNRPVATGSGEMYVCNDIPVLYIDDPTTKTWLQYTSEYIPKPPGVSTYTVVGNMGIQSYGDSIRAMYTSTSSITNAAALTPSAALGASALWKVTMVATILLQFDQQYPELGVCVSNGTTSGTSVSYVASFSAQDYSGANVQAEEMIIGTTTRNALIGGVNYEGWLPWHTWGTGRAHLRLLNDGAVLHYQVGNDGFNWYDFMSTATPTPSGGFTNYGFSMQNGQGSAPNYLQSLIHENTLGTPVSYTVTGYTNASPSVITIGTHSIQAGDIVSINGAANGLNTSTSTGAGPFNSGVIVTSVTSSTITTTQNTTGTGATGTVILLSR